MRIGYLLIRPDGSTKLGKVDWGKHPRDLEYEALSAIIRNILQLEAGRNFEQVQVWFNDSYLSMFVDDFGAGKLPVNLAATAIYHANVRVHQPATPDSFAEIYGPALIFFDRVWY